MLLDHIRPCSGCLDWRECRRFHVYTGPGLGSGMQWRWLCWECARELGERWDEGKEAEPACSVEDASAHRPDYIKEVLRTYAGRDTWEDKLTLGALGLAGEAGEVVDIVKKWRYQGHGFDALRFRDEMGDVLWYLALMCSAFGWTLDDVMAANIRKMHERYPDGFSIERSLYRKEDTANRNSEGKHLLGKESKEDEMCNS